MNFKKLVFPFFFFIFLSKSFSQQDSTKHLRISLITCASGNELYSIFGHTAIRIIDSTNHSDIFYNYGTFNFDDPNFLLKFIRGKLDYYLSVEDGAGFLQNYQQEGRTVFEQVLHLTATQKNNIQQALILNLSGNNKYYKYDFLFDNCTTRAREILKQNTTLVCNQELVAKGTTFRNMLYQYLDSGGACWSKLGIDILLGSKIDVPVTMEQSTFLPDYLMHSVDSFNYKNLFIADRNVYAATPIQQQKNNNLPLIIFSCLAIIVLLLSASKNKNLQVVFRYYSMFMLLLTGLLGCILLFMWLATDHKSCGNNYNVLWALPTNIIALFFVNKKSQKIKNYFTALMAITGLLVVFWFLLPQQFNLALFPFVFSMMFCYNGLRQHCIKKI